MPYISKLGKKSARGFKGLTLPVEYQAQNSLRFRSSALTYLARTPTIAGNRKTFTFSAWVKRGILSANQLFFSCSAGSNANKNEVMFVGDQLRLETIIGGSSSSVITQQVFRDAAAWYHIVIAVDTTQATAADRVKMYVNGSQVTQFSSANYPAQDFDMYYNSTNQHLIGAGNQFAGQAYSDLYMAEVCFVDGMALGPSFFAQVSRATGIWSPKDYKGSFGTNGFYLKFPLVPEPTPTPIAVNKYSARFRQSASAYLSRTPATASGQNQWTYSVWVKLGSLAQAIKLLLGNTLTGGTNRNEQQIDIEPSGQLCVWAFDNTTGYYFNRFSDLRLRDYSAWYHIVVQFDPDNATSANRINAWVNNQAVTWASSADSGAAGSISDSGYRSINNTFQNFIGAGVQGGNPPVYFVDCYMAEINMVSGAIVAPTEFGQYAPSSMRWYPKTYTGTYGTNGFYLQFNQPSAVSDFGIDSSGNSNTWTVNNLSLTAGSTYDSMTDYPDTLLSTTAANYCTLNPLPTQNFTYSNGNLSAVSRATGDASCIATMGVTSGKWYFEATIASNAFKGVVGILGTTSGSFADSVFTRIGSDQALGYDFRAYDGMRRNNSVGSAYYGSAIPDNATVGVAFDLDNNRIFVSVNGAWVASSDPVTGANPMFNLTAGATYFPSLGDDWGTESISWNVNFGQRPFAYAIPQGYLRLNTFNLPVPTVVAPDQYMTASLYTDNGTNQSIITPFAPDFIWLKCRTAAYSNGLYNTVNGRRRLVSDNTQAEDGRLLDFNNDGFTVDPTTLEQSYAGNSYVGWSWKGGGTAVSNTSGSITSSVSANPTAGFSIVSWTGNGNNSDQTVGTGLSTPLDLIIPKARTANVGSNSWLVYSSAVPMGQNQCLILDSTSALISTADQGTVNRGATAGQIRLFAGSLSGLANQNFNGNNVQYVAYCFSAVAGYSASGSFTGNGSTEGPFVYCGFRPRFILTKCSSNSTSSTVWTIVDTTRNTNNPALRELYPNSSSTEFTDSDGMDILSNGFRPRRNSEYLNFNGWTYIYMAFAESPFKYAGAR